ncbi:hypothetical protein [Candidatus Uabimicrobium sp. HlEnr_7]|uniref:hypothetical protein n=1 Tax=Candidatus Uabimicrobium helgolandensis TaxID=3095367 RepID=UPI0035591CA8
MNEDILKRYVHLKRLIKNLQKELDDISPNVYSIVSPYKKLIVEGANLQANICKSWVYSNEVDLLKKILEQKKQDEIKKGIAKLKKETKFVSLFEVKKESDVLPINQEKHDNQVDSVKQENIKKLEIIRGKYPKAYQKWSLEDDLKLEQKFQEDTNIKNLAEEFQRQPGAIRARLKKLRLIE